MLRSVYHSGEREREKIQVKVRYSMNEYSSSVTASQDRGELRSRATAFNDSSAVSSDFSKLACVREDRSGSRSSRGSWRAMNMHTDRSLRIMKYGTLGPLMHLSV